jgi:hypothetical protein
MAAERKGPPIRGSDVRGLTRLGVDAVVGVTDLVEAMHHTITQRTGIVGKAPAGRTKGITGFVYGAVRGTTKLAGKGLDLVLDRLAGPATTSGPPNATREALLAVINGLWGDHLAETGNPLAITMALRTGGHPLGLARESLAAAFPQPGRKLLVLLHGLCMNDLQWSRNGHDHGAMLAREGGYTPLYAHYNSGLHVSHNGSLLAALLETLVASWPEPVDELVLLGHSMGGLLARSALHQAITTGQAWPGRLKALVFLGTPHHGAPLERGGHRIDMLFGISPYAAPFARLGKARSAGITDLRYGNLQDADWKGRDRYAQRHDDRRPTPLPAHVPAYAVAATLGDVGGLRDRLLGDGLVPVPSAFGEHADPALALALPDEHRCLVTAANHWDLLDHAQVQACLRRWLAG